MFFGHEADVLVVGAGPAGLMSALILAERGVSVEVIDEEQTNESHNYALTLHPSALALLDDLGLANALLAKGVRIDKVAFCDRTGVRAQLHLGELQTEFPFLLTVPRMALEQLLEQRLKEKKVAVHWSQRLAAINPNDKHLACTVEKLGMDSVGYSVQTTMQVVEKERHITPRFVVGADGFFSAVRRRLGIEIEPSGPAQGYAPTEFSTDFDAGGQMRVVFDEGGAAVMFPLPGGRCRFTVELKGSDIPPADSPYIPLGSRLHPGQTAESFEADLRRRAPWYTAERTTMTWAGKVRFEPGLARRFGVGRAWLVGDAAHITGPIGVQSLNEGLREAHDLGSRIARILKVGDSHSLLEQYHAQRTADWRPLLGLLPRLETTPATDPWITRNLARVVSCTPATGPDLASLLQQLGLKYTAA